MVYANSTSNLPLIPGTAHGDPGIASVGWLSLLQLIVSLVRISISADFPGYHEAPGQVNRSKALGRCVAPSRCQHLRFPTAQPTIRRYYCRPRALTESLGGETIVRTSFVRALRIPSHAVHGRWITVVGTRMCSSASDRRQKYLSVGTVKAPMTVTETYACTIRRLPSISHLDQNNHFGKMVGNLAASWLLRSGMTNESYLSL